MFCKYMGLSIKWVSLYMYMAHIQPPCFRSAKNFN